MPTFGTQPTFSGSEFYGISTTPYQIGQLVTNWPGGVISDINVYFGGWSGAVNAALCIWDSFGNLLQNTSTFSVAAASGTGAGQQAWQTVSGLSWTVSAASAGIIIGLWRDPAGRFAFSRDGNNTFWKGTNSSVGFLNGATTSTGTLGAYVTYTPGGIKVYSSGGAAFNKYKLKRYDSGLANWVWNAVRTYDTPSLTWKRRA